MTKLNSMAAGLSGSATFAMAAKAAALKAKGVSVADLSTGEPEIDTPEHIKEAAARALREGKTKYTPVAGIPKLRELVAQKLTNDNDIPTKAAQVIITNGGKQAIHEALQVTISPGDEVIIPAPYWVSYPSMVEIALGKPVVVKTDVRDGYRLTAKALKAALTPRTKWVVLNSPANPTGAGYSSAQMKELGEVLKGHQALILSDEVYEKVVFGEFKFASFAQAVPELRERTLTVNAFSKTYSMTGWRVGYATGPAEIISAMEKFQGQTTSGINSIAQYAAVAALEGSHEFVSEMIWRYQGRIDFASEAFNATPGLSVPLKPEGAFYLFVRIDQLLAERGKPAALSGSQQFAEYILEKEAVSVVPGNGFGDDGAFRISVAAADEILKEGVARIQRAVHRIMGTR